MTKPYEVLRFAFSDHPHCTKVFDAIFNSFGDVFSHGWGKFHKWAYESMNVFKIVELKLNWWYVGTVRRSSALESWKNLRASCTQVLMVCNFHQWIN